MDFYFAQVDGVQIRDWLRNYLGLSNEDFYLTFQGKLVQSDTFVEHGIVHVHPTVRGGKGGFGSMLRAIGAQIEKTTNREACRDLSGRRLRDINEEKRLKNWIDNQAEREKEAKERRQKKLEKLCEPPKHEFNDEEYNKERSVLPDMVEDAVLQGLQATASCSVKRKLDKNEVVKKKKLKLWVDSDLEDGISDDDSDDMSDSYEKTSSKQIEGPTESITSNSENSSKENEDVIESRNSDPETNSSNEAGSKDIPKISLN